MLRRLCVVLLVLFSAASEAGPRVEILKGGYFTPAYEGPAVQPEGRPTALRGRCEWLLYAEKDAQVRFKVTCFQVGNYKDSVTFSLSDSNGRALATGQALPSETKESSFVPPESGAYRLLCNAGQNASEVEAANARVCMPAGDGQSLAVVDHARRMWFYVPRNSQGFKVRVSSPGKAETVAIKIWSPDGKEAATGSTVSSAQAALDVAVKMGQDDSLWSLQMLKAAEGLFEDAQLELSGGVGPYVAEKPADLLVPLLSVDLPTIYRRSSGAPLSVWCSFLAPAQMLGRPYLFVKMIDPATGESIYSEMLIRFETGNYKVRLPQDKVSRGSFLARLTLRQSETVIHTLERKVRVIDRPANLRQDNVTLVGGNPFFARGLYHVQSKDYELVKKQGFNLVQAGPNQIPDCERAGLKAAVVLYGGMKIDEAYYRENIAKYKSSPAVACWMIMDEPCGHRMPVHEVEQAYALIRELDPDHPAYMCLCPCTPTVYREYGQATDIIAIDVYPVGLQPLTDIAEKLEMAKADAPEQPVWFIGQVWSWPGKVEDGALRAKDKSKRTLVTAAQHRCMTYLALTHDNARGLMWYSFSDPDWYLPDSNPELWAACKRVNDELIALEPVLLEANKWERVVKGEGEVHLCLKEHEDKLYLIGVNPTEKAMPLTFNLAEENPQPEAKVLFEDRTVKLTGTTLLDRFDPLAVHVYEIIKQEGQTPGGVQ